MNDERTDGPGPWATAWWEALAETVDPERLARGRAAARRGAVGAVVIESGVARAQAGGSGRPITAEIWVRPLATEAWSELIDLLASKSVHSSAVSDGELDWSLLDDAANRGIEVMIGPGDLRPGCSCPAWAEPCQHAAAVEYLIGAELDRDPFQLLLLRGKGAEEVRTLVRQRRLERAEGPASETDVSLDSVAGTVDGAQSWGGSTLAQSELLAVPAPQDRLAEALMAPSQARRPLAWDVRVPDGVTVDPALVDEVAMDATVRSWLLLVDGRESGLRTTERGDLARRAASVAHQRELAVLSARTRVSTAALTAWAKAWELGGDVAIEVIADPDCWSTDQQILAGGRDDLVALGIPKRSVALNYDSLGMPSGVRLVVGPDRRWYRLQAVSGVRGTPDQLNVADPPSHDIVDLVDEPTE